MNERDLRVLILDAQNALKAGDTDRRRQSEARIVAMIGPHITIWCRRTLFEQHRGDFEDLSQEILIQVNHSLHTFPGDFSSVAWLFCIARRTRTRWVRRRNNHQEGEVKLAVEAAPHGAPPGAPDAEDAAQMKEFLRFVRATGECPDLPTRLDALHSTSKETKALIRNELWPFWLYATFFPEALFLCLTRDEADTFLAKILDKCTTADVSKTPIETSARGAVAHKVCGLLASSWQDSSSRCHDTELKSEYRLKFTAWTEDLGRGTLRAYPDTPARNQLKKTWQRSIALCFEANQNRAKPPAATPPNQPPSNSSRTIVHDSNGKAGHDQRHRTTLMNRRDLTEADLDFFLKSPEEHLAEMTPEDRQWLDRLVQRVRNGEFDEAVDAPRLRVVERMVDGLRRYVIEPVGKLLDAWIPAVPSLATASGTGATPSRRDVRYQGQDLEIEVGDVTYLLVLHVLGDEDRINIGYTFAQGDPPAEPRTAILYGRLTLTHLNEAEPFLAQDVELPIKFVPGRRNYPCEIDLPPGTRLDDTVKVGWQFRTAQQELEP